MRFLFFHGGIEGRPLLSILARLLLDASQTDVAAEAMALFGEDVVTNAVLPRVANAAHDHHSVLTAETNAMNV